jgi:LuxR family transcriptional regulator, maltose regulon positive regulatory protein
MSSEPAALAATKFMTPRPPAAMVSRPRLIERLDAGVEGTLTLLAAPAGAGKSALLSDWVASRPDGAVAWFSLDATDADRRRFWRGVLEALRRAGLGEPVASLAVHPGEAVDVVLPALVNALAERTEPIVLVLDDLHEVGESVALADLDRLLRHPIGCLRAVIATRADPTLRLGRLRVAGQLTEIRAADLTFTLQEAHELLAAAGADGSPELVERLRDRTEGWAAGLRLAAQTLRSHPDPERFVDDFAGDDRTVADYLVSEVLAQQPPDLREFLLRISVVDRVSAEFAAALTGRSDAERVLARLERDHALLSSTGGARAWHTLHPLFAELLRSQLRFAAPTELPVLHRRAASWLEAHDRPTEALHHAAAAQDWPHVGALAGGHWVPLLLEGELNSLLPIFERLPEELVAGDPEIAIAMAAVQVDAGNEPASARWCDVARIARDAVAPERRGNFDLALATVGLLRGRLRGDADAALENARVLLERHRPLLPSEPGDDDLRALALCQLGIAELWSGDLDRAGRDLEAGRAAAHAAGRDWLELICACWLGTHATWCGHYERPLRLGQEAEVLAKRRGWERTWPIGVVHATRSTMALHRERLDEADEELALARELLRAVTDPPVRASIELQSARILSGRGSIEPALEAVQEARQWIRAWPMMASIRGAMVALEATLHARMGERTEAESVLRLAAAEDGAYIAETAAAVARLLLRDGDANEALNALAPHLDEPVSPLRSTRTEICVLAALAHDALGDPGAAAGALERALGQAEPGGMRRPFLAHGTAIAPLLRRHLRNGTRHRALTGELLDAVERPAGEPPGSVLATALSSREEAVLRFLPTMMSNHEIAAEMFVSVNTVKTHLKAIYRKLDVTDRRAAVRRARSLNLLSP